MATVDRTTPTDTQEANTKKQESPKISVHPQYRVYQPKWIKIDDCLQGEDQIKAKGEDYLPKTSGQEASGSNGQKAYDAYQTRAIYYNFPLETSATASGMMSREKAKYELPTAMQGLEQSANQDGDPLQLVHNDVNKNQVEYGRFGLLVDVPQVEAPDSPYLVDYHAFSILNWGTKMRDGKIILSFVLLDESHYELNKGLEHQWVYRYRICALDPDDRYFTEILEADQLDSLDPNEMRPSREVSDGTDGQEAYNPYPNFKGNELDFVPFVFINVDNLDTDIQVSPLQDICDKSISIYRGEADYRQTLFMQGQDTFYGMGLAEDERPDFLGATAAIYAKNPDAEVGFASVSGDALAEQREGQDDLKSATVEKSMALLDTSNTESGKALGIRIGSKTSKLKKLVRTGAAGLTKALQYVNMWMTDTRDETEDIKVMPNMDFIDNDEDSVADDLVKLMQAKNLGAPLSNESVHQWMQKKELTNKDFETEEADAQAEGPTVGGGMV